MTIYEKQQSEKINQLYKGSEVDNLFQKAKELSESPKFKKVMDEWKEGKLESSSGEKITDQKQALAIAFSEARKVEKSENDDLEKGGVGSGRKKDLTHQKWLEKEEKRQGKEENKRFHKVPESIERNGETHYLVSHKDEHGHFHPKRDEDGKYHYESGLGKVLKINIHKSENDDSVEKKMIGKDLKKFEHLENKDAKNPDKEDSDKVVKKSEDIETLTPHSENSETEGFQELEDEKLIDDFDEDNKDVEKGGEGSRVGVIIGHTKSGKPVYNHRDPNHHKGFEDWSHDDHKEAASYHEKHSAKLEEQSKNKFKEGKEKHSADLAKQADNHKNIANSHKKRLEKSESQEILNINYLSNFEKSQAQKILSMYNFDDIEKARGKVTPIGQKDKSGRNIKTADGWVPVSKWQKENIGENAKHTDKELAQLERNRSRKEVEKNDSKTESKTDSSKEFKEELSKFRIKFENTQEILNIASFLESIKNGKGVEIDYIHSLGNVNTKSIISSFIKDLENKGIVEKTWENYKRVYKLTKQNAGNKEAEGKLKNSEGSLYTAEGEKINYRIYSDGGVKLEGLNMRKDFSSKEEAEKYINKENFRNQDVKEEKLTVNGESTKVIKLDENKKEILVALMEEKNLSEEQLNKIRKITLQNMDNLEDKDLEDIFVILYKNKNGIETVYGDKATISSLDN